MAQKSFVESGKLKEFQGKLQLLADNLMDLHDTLSRNLVILNEDWDDPKYDEFVSDFERDKQRIVEISEAFTDEAKINLQHKYEQAVAIENVR